ncbi:MAG TPA: Yip1 family protein [Casimicrobiaceae bacterium]|nr:Yip1 family protein [Casimicrobiaceae bacterium]
MNLVERVKGMLLAPRSEWPQVASEPMSAQDIYTKWVMLLAAIGPVAIAIGYASTLGFGASLRFAIANYLIVLLMTAVIALIVDGLAPHFGGTKDFVSALKLSAFSYTPAYLAGVFHLLGHYGGVLVLLASIYAWYLFYLGATVLRKASDDKAVVFTIIIVVIGFVLGMLLGGLASRGGFAPG